MGDPITMGAAALSVASVGLSAAGKGVAAQGTSTADLFKAQTLDQSATYGELKATQVGGQLTRNLDLQLGNIDAVRAANRTDPTSPTGIAVHDYVESVGEQQRDTKVDTIMQQARTDEASAAYMRQASSTALLGGDLGIAGTLLSGAAGLFKGGGG
jgi:hypothetical protein